MAKTGTTRVAMMVTWPRLGLPEWPRWLLGQDGDKRSGSYDHMANTGPTRVAQMTITLRLGLPEWSRWLHGQDGANRVDQVTTWPTWGRPDWPRWLHGQDGYFKSGLDDKMVKIVTKRKALMATWPKWGTTRVAYMAT